MVETKWRSVQLLVPCTPAGGASRKRQFLSCGSIHRQHGLSSLRLAVCVKEGGSQETTSQQREELVLQSSSSHLSASQAARPPQALPATEPVLGTNPSSSILNNQWHPVQTTSDHVGPALTCQWLPSQSQTLQYRICHCASLHSPRFSLRAPWILHGCSRPAPASGSNCCSLVSSALPRGGRGYLPHLFLVFTQVSLPDHPTPSPVLFFSLARFYPLYCVLQLFILLTVCHPCRTLNSIWKGLLCRSQLYSSTQNCYGTQQAHNQHLLTEPKDEEGGRR